MENASEGLRMTRQHFCLIAEVIAQHQERAQHVFGDVLLAELTSAFAERLAATNDRFDRGRFLAACGVRS
jgi:hypothetical protein